MNELAQEYKDKLELSNKKMREVQDKIVDIAGSKQVIIYGLMQLISIVILIALVVITFLENDDLVSSNSVNIRTWLLASGFIFLIFVPVPLGIILISYGGYKQSKKLVRIGLSTLHVMVTLLLVYILSVMIKNIPYVLMGFKFSSTYMIFELIVLGFIGFLITLLITMFINLDAFRGYFIRRHYKTCKKPKLKLMIALIIVFTVFIQFIMFVPFLNNGSIGYNNIIDTFSNQFIGSHWVVIIIRWISAGYSIYLLFFIQREIRDIDFNDEVIEETKIEELVAHNEALNKKTIKVTHQRKTLDDL